MRITSYTLLFLNEKGINHVRQSIINGLKRELKDNGGENGDFDAVCEMWEPLEKTAIILPAVINELNDCDSEDMFGTEGWEQRFGLND